MEPNADQQAQQLDGMDDLLVVRPRRMGRQSIDIDITPMIDIVFLLLIFFLVTSKLAQQAGVELPEARYGDAVAVKQSVVITIDRGVGDEALVYKGDGVHSRNLVRAAEPAAQQDELVRYISAGLQDSPRKRHVLIKAAAGVKHRHVARVSQAAGRALQNGRLYVAVLETD